MPQMAPILWLFLLISTTIILNMISSNIYFFQQKTVDYSSELSALKSSSKKAWKW